MTSTPPRIVAGIAFVIGLAGMLISFPLLSSIGTSFLFLLGALAWAFLGWRAFCREYKDIFLAGWLWSSILHLACIPLSTFIPAFLGSGTPVRSLITIILILSIAGLFIDLAFKISTRQRNEARTSKTRIAEQGGEANAS